MYLCIYAFYFLSMTSEVSEGIVYLCVLLFVYDQSGLRRYCVFLCLFQFFDLSVCLFYFTLNFTFTEKFDCNLVLFVMRHKKLLLVLVLRLLQFQILKFLCKQEISLLELFTKIKKGSGTSFWCTFFDNFFIKILFI